MPTILASLEMGNDLQENGLVLNSDLAGKEGTVEDGRTEVAVAGGRVCRRMRHLKMTLGNMGYWRGPEARQIDVSAKGMYLKATDSNLWNKKTWMEITYFDDGLGYVAITTCDGACPEPNRWFHLVDSQTWHTVVIEIPPLENTGSLPLNSDVQLESENALNVSLVRILDAAPQDFVSAEAASSARCIELLPVSTPHEMFFQIGNIGGIQNAGDLGSAQAIYPWLAIYKGLGATSIQSYVKWSRVEEVEGVEDWSYYDDAVEELKKHDLRWVIFVMLGQSYSMPKWTIEGDNGVFATCVEHGFPSGVQSIWNPRMIPWAEEWIKKLSDHVDHDIVEGIMLGPSGDFGETTYNGVFTSKGLYHTHVGHWCGDGYAAEDFHSWLNDRYGDLKSINSAWGTELGDMSDISPSHHEKALSSAQWSDQVAWTTHAMTVLSEKWAEITRRNFPGIPIYHAAGGAGDPVRGGQWSDQSKASALHNVGARVTNEGADYEFNFAYTNWQATACKFYGTPFGNEPWGGDMCGMGVVGRAFNAIAFDADHFWISSSHVKTREGLLGLKRSMRHLRRRPDRKIDLAVYYPWTHFVATDERGFSEDKPRSLFWPKLEELRDILDIDLIDQTLARDGALAEYPLLLLLHGPDMEPVEIEQIVSWVEAGGVLIADSDNTPVSIADGGNPGEHLFEGPSEKKHGFEVRAKENGKTALWPGSFTLNGSRGDDMWDGDHEDHPSTVPAFWADLVALMRDFSSLGDGFSDLIVPDGERDGVYATTFSDGFLFFNQTMQPVTKEVQKLDGSYASITIPAGDMAEFSF